MKSSINIKTIFKIITLGLLICFFVFLNILNLKKFSEQSTVTSLKSAKQKIEPEKEIANSVTYVNYLRSQGIDVTIIDIINSPKFSTAGLSTLANGKTLTIYHYYSSNKAKNDAKTIVKNFVELTNVNLTAIHYFRKDTLLVEYAGDDKTILSILEDTLGPQFAGE